MSGAADMEVYEEFCGSSTQKVIGAADGHSTEIRREFVSKERGRSGRFII